MTATIVTYTDWPSDGGQFVPYWARGGWWYYSHAVGDKKWLSYFSWLNRRRINCEYPDGVNWFTDPWSVDMRRRLEWYRDDPFILWC